MKSTAALIAAGFVAAVSLASPALAHPRATTKPTGRIFYLREGHNGKHEFSMAATGNSIRRVRNVKLDTIAYPAPKAHLIVYSVAAGEFKQDLVVASYAGTVKHRYSPPGLDSLLSVSPNGKYLGLEKSTSTGRFVFAITTTTGRTVATLFHSNNPGAIAESWRANSKQVVLMNPKLHSSTLTIYNHDGKRVRTLPKINIQAFGVAWSSAGGIAYSTNEGIDVMRQSGGKPRVLVKSQRLADGGLSYSPNGRYLAYGLDAGNNGQIWRVNADGTNPVKLTSNGAEPAWG